MTVKEVNMNEIENWVMPKPSRGQQVLWFPHASKHEEPEIAFIKEFGKRSVVINVNGVAWDGVRHINDPKLELNEFQRQNGAWAFVDADNGNADLIQRIETLEKQVTVLMARSAKKE